MPTCAPLLDVGKKRLWRNFGIKSLCVLEFLHPIILDNSEDEPRCLSPHRLVGAAVSLLGFVRRLCARTDDGRGVIIDRRVVGANYCGFDEFRTISCCIRCHRLNEANEVVCASHFRRTGFGGGAAPQPPEFA